MPTWVNYYKEKIPGMNEYRTQDTISALWDDIEMHHLAYLQEDKNLMKLEEKRRLEALIKRYLTLIPPQKKFLFPSTRQVLHDSIQISQEFSCFKTASAWRCIATYAHNLLTQPWRKEYRIIKLFNGFYKHNIESSLVGGEIMLELMGYSKIRDTLILEGPVDPDKVAGVSKDSFIATVECQIMRSIYADVFKINKDIQWIDVFMHRETYPGTIEEAVNALSQRHNLYSFNYQNPTAFYQPSLYPVSHTVQQPVYTISQHQVVPQMQLDQVYQSDGFHYSQAIPDYCTPSLIPHPQHYLPCPTAQLIEYDHTFQPVYHQQLGQHHRRSSSDHAVSTSGGEVNYISHTRRPSYGYRTSDCANTWNIDQTEMWSAFDQDFINRENQGNPVEQNAIAHQDIGAVGSSSREQLIQPETSDPAIDELEANFKNLFKDCLNQDTKSKVSSSRKKKKSKYLIGNSSTQHSISPAPDWCPPPLYSRSLRVNLSQDKWNCQFCTFLNSSIKEVCEMCGKSKSNDGEIPLASGGRQCPKCTLVNKKGATKCDVCESSLKDSATYI